jgi:hypothetical protein
MTRAPRGKKKMLTRVNRGAAIYAETITSVGNTGRKSASLRVRMLSNREAKAPMRISAKGHLGTLPVRLAVT